MKAGYKYSTQNVASVEAGKLLKNPNVSKYINEKLQQFSENKIATAEEILTYWTDVMRGNSESEVVVMVGKGEGISEPKRIKKKPDEKERLIASKELAKRIIDVAREENKEAKLEKLLDLIENDIGDDDFE